MKKLFDLYVVSKSVYCDPHKLQQYVKVNSSSYVQIEDAGIPNFWPAVSKFMCNLNSTTFSYVTANLGTDFALPKTVKDV